MKLDFIINKYLLIWNLLYQKSKTLEIQEIIEALKRYNNKEFIKLEQEKDKILKDFNNYIPDDDIVFNYCERNDYYKKIKKETNYYRLKLLESWDKSKKLYIKELTKILKYNISCSYTICVLHPNLNMILVEPKQKMIISGKKVDVAEKDSFFILLIYQILKNEYENFKPNENEIVMTVLELVILNELYSKITNTTKYFIGNNETKKLKNKIYPYFLMYLGIGKKDFIKRMDLDNIYFNESEINYDDSLQLMDLYSFINYVIKNKETIVSKKTYLKNPNVETL